ncbi:E2 SUMO-conjugating protein ubc9 [Chytriomyces hyalinus]|nr:E2 SUMO-conjugating protein ubc9 [Chytriomyces hyalinus]
MHHESLKFFSIVFLHSAFGFWAKPDKNADNSLNLRRWSVGIPGKNDTPWEGGVYTMTVTFPAQYPQKPPVCKFNHPIHHPNVYPDGKVCLSILNEGVDWKPSITITQILCGIQDLLNEPNPDSPANIQAQRQFCKSRKAYDNAVRKQAILYAPRELE